MFPCTCFGNTTQACMRVNAGCGTVCTCVCVIYYLATYIYQCILVGKDSRLSVYGCVSASGWIIFIRLVTYFRRVLVCVCVYEHSHARRNQYFNIHVSNDIHDALRFHSYEMCTMCVANYVHMEYGRSIWLYPHATYIFRAFIMTQFVLKSTTKSIVKMYKN